MTTINASLTTAEGTQIGTDYYWSSSQSSSDDGYAWQVDFSDGYVRYDGKYNDEYVRVIRAF